MTFSRRINLRRLFGMVLLTVFSFLTAEAQNTSNSGKDFWVAYAAHIDAYNSQMSLYITSTLATSGTVAIPGRNFSVSYTVQPNAVTIVDIPPLTAYVESSESVEAKGIHITAEDPVVVYAHIYSQNRSGATLVLPTATLGREYYTIGYTQKFRENMKPVQYAQFMVVAVEDNTLVEITPTAATRKGKAANVPFNVTLMKGEVYQVQSDTDLTGSKVQSVSTGPTSCKRIAVFSGSSFTPLGCAEAKSGDNLIQQLYPISAWGENYVTAPLKTRVGGDIFRVMAATDGTTIILNDTLLTTLDKGRFFDFERKQVSFLEASNPVMLAQYPRSQNCDKVTGDPEMIILSPVEQQLKHITLYSSPFYKIKGHYINVFMKTADAGSFRMDGKPVDFNVIPSNPAYSYSRNTVAKGNHTLTADNGFNAIAYGFGNVESYGYSAGANLKNLNHYVTFGAETYCDGETASFTGFASYTPKSWKWYFGDGNVSTAVNPTHLYDEPGVYTVSMVTIKNNGNDCDSRDSTAVELTVYPNPEAAFTVEGICHGAVTMFQDASTTAFNGNDVVSWHWDFGDGMTANEQHPAHEYATPGFYDVKLQVTTAQGCTSQMVRQIKIHPLPVTDFVATPVCASDAMTFQDETTIPEGTVNQWEWDFGDGQTSTMQHPVHRYDGPGTYMVSLKVTSEMGCQRMLSKGVTVYPEPQVDMTLPAICLKDEAEFTNTSAIASGTMAYKWEFGDGSFSTDEHPRHKYTKEGVYNVTLLATSDKGCQNSKTVEYTVSGAEPVPAFTFTDICQKDTVKFNDESRIAFGNIIAWQWDFGDGTTSEEQHPAHIYQNPGTYTVGLTVYSGIICNNSITRTITILPSPDAGFMTANVCEGEETVFQNTSGMSTGGMLVYKWDFGDGAGSSARDPEYYYPQHGTYMSTLTVTAENGCEDRYGQQVTIYPGPQVMFLPERACLPEGINFKDESTLASGSLISWQWNFGDGNTSTE